MFAYRCVLLFPTFACYMSCPSPCLHLLILTHTKKVQTMKAWTTSFSPPSHESHPPPNTPNIYFDSRNAHDHALRCATGSNAAAASLSISVFYTNSSKLQRQQIGYLEAKIFLSPVHTYLAMSASCVPVGIYPIVLPL